MHGPTLDAWLSAQVFRVLLAFVRIGAAFLLLPGFGEPAVPSRMRLLAALAVAFAVAPTIAGLPSAAPTTWQAILAATAEATVGALLGLLSRVVVSALLIAGQVIGQTIGLTNIFTNGLAVDESPTIGAALYAGVLAVLFASGGHRVMLRALVESYDVLPVGQFPATGPSAHAVVAAGAQAFRLAAQLASPFLLLGLVFNVTLALVNRAMPALHVFMIASPALVMVGLYVLVATVPGLVDGGLSGWSDLLSLLR
jgi:flagellar biosynthetic protein FliR